MAYTVLDSKNIDKKKNIYTFGGSGTKPERDDIAENSKLIDYSSGQKFYYDPTKAAGNKWQPDKEPSGGSGGSLPANFPEESAANANKYVGFDASGNYAALNAPEGGSPTPEEVLTLTVPQMAAQDGAYFGVIQYADLTQEQQYALESLATENYSLFLNTTDRPLTRYVEESAYTMYAYNFDSQGVPAAEDFFAFSVAFQEGQISFVTVTSSSDLTGETLNLIGYVASAPSGGGPFVVTFSGVDVEEGTVESADKTPAQIAEAIAAGKQVIGFVSSDDTANLWMPLINAAVDDDNAFFQFGASLGDATFSIGYGNDGGVPRINFELTELIKRSDVLENTSLIVNLTLDGTGETPVLRGSETYGAIVTARMAGKNVLFNYTGSEGSSSSSLIDCIVESDEIIVYLCSVGEIVRTKGNSTDYFAFNVG